MENILLISGGRTAEVLSEFIRDSFQCDVRTAETAYRARELIAGDVPCELAVINAPLADESGEELARYVTENSSAGCIMIVKAEKADKLSERFGQYGVIVMSKPLNKLLFCNTIRAVETALRRFYTLYAETVRLERQIEEIKAIDKAKFLLMQYKKMTEPQAHAYLERYAMNRRRKKYAAALEIIDMLSEQYM